MASTIEQTTGAEQIEWDLTDLYASPDDPKLDQDLDGALDSARAFRERYHGTVAELDASGLRDALVEQERISSIMSRAESFATLRFSTDTADAERGALLQRVSERATAVQTELLFFRLEWLAVEDDGARALITDPSLAAYAHFLESSRRYRRHVLSEAEEQLATEKRITGSTAWTRLFSELTSAIRVQLDGETVGLEVALSKLQNPDRAVRQRAQQAVTDALRMDIRTRAFVMNTLLHDKSVEDRLRGYPSWIAARNLANEASDESVEALVDAVVGRYDIAQRYYRLKAKLLGIPRLADFDRIAPVSASASFMTWDDARKLVSAAYHDFSPRAGSTIDDFFSKRWIDAAIRPSKRPGAFCATTIPDVHPYVFLSFTGERRSVLTLAHELGHGLHGVLASDCTPVNAHPPLTLAETASVFGEALVFQRLLGEETDPAERLDLLMGRLDDAMGTVFRQVALNRFEDAVHTARRTSGELSVEMLDDAWARTQTDLFGDSVEASDGYRCWWSYIPHFIGTPGYVYAYAFGYLFSLAIFRKYQREGSSVVDPYLRLLAAGGSDAPERLASIVGLDLGDPAFWSDGLGAIDDVLGEAERLAAKR